MTEQNPGSAPGDEMYVMKFIMYVMKFTQEVVREVGISYKRSVVSVTFSLQLRKSN